MIEPKNFWEIPVLKPNIVDAPFQIFDEKIIPVPVKHGNNNINGYRIGNLGYITDASEISENSMKLLEGVDVLLLDCLRMESHFTHLSFPESIEIAKKIDAKETYLIHMTHSLEYESLKKMLPEGVYVGYDGLKLEIN
jgi:phosphoribosyl 1,2-cyclic phosphate phosphodiesterase